jgi:hypothetical protein
MGSPDVTFSSLTPSFQRLVRLMQSIRHGRLRNLIILDGEPSFDPPPTAVRVLKLDRPNVCYPAAACEDFPLRREVLDLITQIRGVMNGTIERLEVVNGMPQLVEVAEPVAPANVLPTTSTRTSGR